MIRKSNSLIADVEKGLVVWTEGQIKPAPTFPSAKA